MTLRMKSNPRADIYREHVKSLLSRGFFFGVEGWGVGIYPQAPGLILLIIGRALQVYTF